MPSFDGYADYMIAWDPICDSGSVNILRGWTPCRLWGRTGPVRFRFYDWRMCWPEFGRSTMLLKRRRGAVTILQLTFWRMVFHGDAILREFS